MISITIQKGGGITYEGNIWWMFNAHIPYTVIALTVYVYVVLSLTLRSLWEQEFLNL